MTTRNLLFTSIMFLAIFGTGQVIRAQTTPSADVVIQWNLVSIKTAKIAKQNTNETSRTVAIEAIAV